MKIKVIKKSKNKLAWSNHQIGKTFTVLYTNKEDLNNIFYLVNLEKLNKFCLSGTILKSECEVIL